MLLSQIQPLLVYGVVVFFLFYNGKHVKGTGGEFVGAVRNLTVKVLPDREYAERKDAYKFFKLNISWLPPNGTRQPSSYSIIVTGMQKKGCPEGSLFYILEGNKQLNASLPEHNNSTELPDLYIQPSCSYKVQVLANPRMKYVANASEVIYTVPECIGLACNCANEKSKLPVPKVNVTRTENQVVVDWSISSDASDVQFYVISIGAPYWFTSKRNKVPLYDVIKIGQVSADKRTFFWNLKASDRKYVEADDDYKITVKTVDYRGCFGPEGSFVLRSLLSDIKTGDDRRIWFVLIGIITSFILFGVLSILLYRNYNNFSVVNQQRNPIGIRTISECKSQRTEAILQKRNILYTKNESEEGYTEETDKLRVPLASVRLIRELGSGQFGKVYLGRLNDTKGSLVAVKMSRQGDTSIGSDARQQLLKEIEMMRTAGNHPHLVNLVGYCVQPTKPICILLEYMQAGDLLTYLHHRRKQHCDETVFDHDQQSILQDFSTSNIEHLKRVRSNIMERKAASENTEGYVNISSGRNDYRVGKMKGYEFFKFATEIALGMEHLEIKGITHRDLAARNILLGADLTIKISDFGLSRNGVYVITARKNRAQHLPIRWMSPEALHNRIFSSKSDVWSFGVVLWEMSTLGGFPYSNVTDDRLLRYVIYENGRLEQPIDVPLNIYKLMHSCWTTEPESRPNFTEIISRLRILASFDDRPGTISNPCYAFS
ncbi:uncharacterized protein LOC143427249 [Xylocopa sonorina]|uniref:uncharacterized protein LOC143427249 n=1 Tax=Xylocopa sonorina TaxID=1818115 RepID=UPI00403B0E31